MPFLEISSSSHTQMLDLSADVSALIPVGFGNGLCHIHSLHTTAGLTINENADPDVIRDMTAALERLVPWNDASYHHAEGNSAAHLKASMMGFSVSVPVLSGRLALGTWQGIYFCEYDGPRRRKLVVTFLKGD